MKKLIFILIAALGVTSACQGKDNPEPVVPSVTPSITATPSTLDFAYGASSQTLSVKANCEWGVASSDATWCTVSPTGGLEGTTSVTVTVLANASGKDRNATLQFKSGSYKNELSLLQHLNPADTADVKEEDIPTPSGYKLVWHDEFTSLNKDNWWFETGDGGWGNHELQRYINVAEGKDSCAVVKDGRLHIIAKQVGNEVLSIRMNTSKGWTYGYFEARLKLPVGKGTWPAFWMMPKDFKSWPDDGEIDIMEEVGYRPNYVSSSVHCKAYYHSIGTQKTGEQYVATAQTEFHVYALEWTDSYISGYVDGVRHFHFTNDKTGNKDTWPFNMPFYLKLNLAWGGDWGGAQGVDPGCLPATYQVDYVRVFQKK